ncbi:hypothetical protein ELF56_22355, partial [Salmonella enterica]|nr:hypothetical protein [Salmonella enterica]
FLQRADLLNYRQFLNELCPALLKMKTSRQTTAINMSRKYLCYYRGRNSVTDKTGVLIISDEIFIYVSIAIHK